MYRQFPFAIIVRLENRLPTMAAEKVITSERFIVFRDEDTVSVTDSHDSGGPQGAVSNLLARGRNSLALLLRSRLDRLSGLGRAL